MNVKTYLLIAAFDFLDNQKGDVIATNTNNFNNYERLATNERFVIVGVGGMSIEESQFLLQPKYKIIDGEYYQLIKKAFSVDVDLLVNDSDYDNLAFIALVSEKAYEGDL